jgi:predicted nuclease of predicted toxin-antitoxin system
MRSYLDDNRAGKKLLGLLQNAGHLVVCPADVGRRGVSDARHLEYAIRESLVVLTGDREDYWELHDLVLASKGAHPGILLVRYQNDTRRDMKAKHILAAVGKLEQSGVTIVSQIVVLNHWR